MDFEKVARVILVVFAATVLMTFGIMVYKDLVDTITYVNGVEYHRVNGKTFQTNIGCDYEVKQ